MNYPTLMVHLQPGRSNAGVLQIAGSLAERFEAAVIGIAARRPMSMTYTDGYVLAQMVDQDRAAAAEELKAAEAEFRAALQWRIAALEWRSETAHTAVCDTLASELRSADLLITSAAGSGTVDLARAADTGDLLMRAGRPVLLVPADFEAAPASQPMLQRAVVCWNDSRESRRAIVDALPLLRTAAYVAVVSVATAGDLPAARQQVAQVGAWLGRHGVSAEAVASRATTGDHAEALDALARQHAADLVVAGAYGHSRLREWVLGGVTRQLLLRPDRCALLSH